MMDQTCNVLITQTNATNQKDFFGNGKAVGLKAKCINNTNMCFVDFFSDGTGYRCIFSTL